MKKWLSAVLVVAVTLTAGIAPAAADDDDDDRDDDEWEERDDDDRDEAEVILLTERSAAITAGDTAWLALNWTAEGGNVSDVAVTVRRILARGVTVTYPTNTATFTGLMNGHYLDEGEVDFTALRVHVPANTWLRQVRMELEIDYTNGGESETQREWVTVPVVRYSEGDHVVQHGSTTEIAAGAAAWVEVDLTGLAPVVEDIRLTATGDLAIVYPGYGTSTSPHGDSVLEDGETDTARFRVDTEGVAPGVYELTTELTYQYNGSGYTRAGTATVTVTG